MYSWVGERKEVRGGLRGGLVKPREKRASTKTYDCDSIMWTDDMGVFLKHNTT